MILITGSRGFLGRYLVDELEKKGEELFLTTSDKAACAEEGRSLFHYLDLGDDESHKELPDKIDTVIHLAAAIPKKNEAISFSKYVDINASGVNKLLESVIQKGCKKFIYASTQMVIEKPAYLPVDEEHTLTPESDYGMTKAVGEKYCLCHSENADIDIISLRFARIYGAGENPGFALTNFIDQAIKKEPLIVYGKGETCRDLLYVKDAVKAIMCAITSDVSGIYNIGSGRGVSIKELAETISEVFSGGEAPVEFKTDKEDSGEDYYLNIEKAKKELNFKPEYDLKKGLTDYKAELSRRI